MKEIQSPRELRGVPLVGGRRSSAIPGTDPLSAVIAKDERGRLFPRAPGPIRRQELVLFPERQGRPLARAGVVQAGRFFR